MNIYVYNKNSNYNRQTTDFLITNSVSHYCKNPAICNITVYRSESGKPSINLNGVFVGVTHTDKLVFVAVFLNCLNMTGLVGVIRAKSRKMGIR